MKKLLAIAISAAALSAMAETVTGSNEIGTLAIQSSLRKTIVAVPFKTLGAGTDVNYTNPSNLVLTTGLSSGDQLYVYNEGAYSGWILQGSTWAAADNSVAGLPERSVADGETTVPLGSGFWLVRAEEPSEEFTFYIYGQYVSGVTSDIVAGAQNLIANPLTKAAQPEIENAFEGDMVLIPRSGPAPRRYTYLDGVWKSGSAVGLPQFAPGTGAWYISAGGSGTTCSWK